MKSLCAPLLAGDHLSPEQITESAEALLDDSIAANDKADFLRALADKGETPTEIAGFVNAFLKHAVDPALDRSALDRPLLDVCGTGGDKLDLFNVSTTSVFVLAACEVAVVKHGNRGITSKSGGADVLEALDIRIDLPPESFGDCVNEVGAGFLFAPAYHPAFKAVVPVRKQLAEEGRRTIFNILGPLLNPVRPDFQLIGVFDENLPPVFAEILGKLGRQRAWAVHGHTETGEGMDEISSIGTTTVTESRNGSLAGTFTFNPSSLGLESATVEDLKGGDAAENAALVRGLFDGSITGPKRDIVLLNAAAGLTICGKATDLADGFALARQAVDSGAAQDRLEAWREFSRRVA